MEFLSNTGWSILAIIVTIVLLLYTGVLSPGKLLTGHCRIVAGISCQDYLVIENQVKLVLENNIDNLQSVTVSINGCTNSPKADGDDSWTKDSILGGKEGIHLLNCPFREAGSKFKEDITISYTTHSGINHTVKGSIATKVI